MERMDVFERSLKMHAEKRGKLQVGSLVMVDSDESLSLAYTPGVAEPCKIIHKDESKVNMFTRRWNLVAVVSDGTAVLGLGDIGPKAAMPVMEGKACLFKAFAGVDAFPICLGTTDVDEIVKTVKYLEPTFGGINLEDISAPRCFEIERRLKEETNIPIFHDDQHGTAVVTLAGMINALKLTGKKMEEIRVVTLGAGAAAIAVSKLLLHSGVQHLSLVDRTGLIYEGREGMNDAKKEMALITNREMRKGGLAEALEGADVFLGLSGPNLVTREMVHTMNKEPIIFAMSNPIPEIMPHIAKAAGAIVVCTGRSDFPNQINNVLAFPGIFRGALDVEASDINEEMKIAAANAIANIVKKKELTAEYVVPKTFDPRVAPSVAMAVAKAAIETGTARKYMAPEWVEEQCRRMTII